MANMTTYTIKPPRKWTVVVAGDSGDARDAVAKWIDGHRPIRDVRPNGPKDNPWSVHCTVWADREQLKAWSADCKPASAEDYAAKGEIFKRGSLIFYFGDGPDVGAHVLQEGADD